MKKSLGFTLLELMVTVAVVGVLLSIALPSFSNSVKNSARTSNTNALIGSLLLARSEAIKRESRVSVCESSTSMNASPSCQVSGKWQNGWVVWADDNSNNAIDAGEDVIQVIAAAEGSGVTIVGTANVAHVASFVSSGFPQTTAGQNLSGVFSICDDRGISDAKAVRVLASGRIRGTSSVAAVGGGC